MSVLLVPVLVPVLVIVLVAWRRLGRNELPLICVHRLSVRPRAVRRNRHQSPGIRILGHPHRLSLRLSDSLKRSFHRLMLGLREMHET